MRQLYTAADIRRLSRDQKAGQLELGPDDMITPEAVDVARELGVRLSHAPGRPAIGPDRSWRASLPPLKVARRGAVLLEPFAAGLSPPGMTVQLKDVITAADGAPMAAGYMSLDAPAQGRGEFPWTLTYDEIDVVLDGELVITRGREVVRGTPGDVLFIPKGSAITFGTPTHARFVYIAFPADWNSSQ